MSHPFKSTPEVIIRTTHWAEAIRFYQDTLGLPITLSNPSIVGFDTGAFRFYVENGDDHGPVFEFLVKDVEETKKRLVAAGCKVIEEDPSVPRCYVKDPYGFVFNLGKE